MQLLAATLAFAASRMDNPNIALEEHPEASAGAVLHCPFAQRHLNAVPRAAAHLRLRISAGMFKMP